LLPFFSVQNLIEKQIDLYRKFFAQGAVSFFFSTLRHHSATTTTPLFFVSCYRSSTTTTSSFSHNDAILLFFHNVREMRRKHKDEGRVKGRLEGPGGRREMKRKEKEGAR
jgi:hypothetical protein